MLFTHVLVVKTTSLLPLDQKMPQFLFFTATGKRLLLSFKVTVRYENISFYQYSKILEEKIVNCVHFHPTISGLLASVSDDCHVKIWRPTEDEAAENSEDEFEFDFPAANVGKIFQKIFFFFI